MTFGNFIGGQWRNNGAVTENINPSDISDVVGEFALASADELGDLLAREEARTCAWRRAR